VNCIVVDCIAVVAADCIGCSHRLVVVAYCRTDYYIGRVGCTDYWDCHHNLFRHIRLVRWGREDSKSFSIYRQNVL